MLTLLDDDSAFGAVRAGARGYLLKDAEPGRIIAAIRAVAAGEAVFSGTVPPGCSRSPLRRRPVPPAPQPSPA